MNLNIPEHLIPAFKEALLARMNALNAEINNIKQVLDEIENPAKEVPSVPAPPVLVLKEGQKLRKKKRKVAIRFAESNGVRCKLEMG